MSQSDARCDDCDHINICEDRDGASLSIPSSECKAEQLIRQLPQ